MIKHISQKLMTSVLVLAFSLPLTVNAQQINSIDLGYVRHSGMTDTAPLSLTLPAPTELEFLRIIDDELEGESEQGKPDSEKYDLPHGIIRLQIIGVSRPGQALNASLEYPTALSRDTQVYTVDGNGYQRLNGIRTKGRFLKITLVDGGKGDLDQMADGVITTALAVVQPLRESVTLRGKEALKGKSVWSLLMMYTDLGT